MPYLFRSAIILRPKQPYVDWANGCAERGRDPVLTLESARRNGTVYLTPTLEGDVTERLLVDEFHSDLFRQAMAWWQPNAEKWPADRSPKTFREWFDVEIIALVMDLIPEAPIDQDNLDAHQVVLATGTCACCGKEIADEAPRQLVHLRLRDRSTIEHLADILITVRFKNGHEAAALRSREDSPAGEEGHDISFACCGKKCGNALRGLLKRGEWRIEPFEAGRRAKPAGPPKPA